MLLVFAMHIADCKRTSHLIIPVEQVLRRAPCALYFKILTCLATIVVLIRPQKIILDIGCFYNLTKTLNNNKSTLLCICPLTFSFFSQNYIN